MLSIQSFLMESNITGQDEVMEKDRDSVLFWVDEEKWMKPTLHEGSRPSKFEALIKELLNNVMKLFYQKSLHLLRV